jgi:sugar (pentulose or hexulose) kinase
MPEPLFLGLDLGTSGARACVIDASGRTVAEGAAAMEGDPREPATWWRATERALDAALAATEPARIRALAIDGTSGTVLPVDASGRPLAPARLYNDPCEDRAILDRIAGLAPPESGAHGATSGLAKALGFAGLPGLARIVHQADWIAGRFSGGLVSDANNALKTGYDPVARRWPDWIRAAGLDTGLLPEVLEPGAPTGRVTAEAAARFGLSAGTLVVAGTTDGCASFLATGASEAGDGVSALGTTLTLKILSDRPVFAPESGIYSHRLLGRWLAGGASNTGGAVLLAHFDAARLGELSAAIDPETESGLDYYPLVRPGERFPVADPALPPRLEPRPADDAAFLHGLLEGIASVEALGYRRLAELGAPPLRRLRSVGGGAANPIWSRIRQRRLGVPFEASASDQAAYGAAVLARHGASVPARHGAVT